MTLFLIYSFDPMSYQKITFINKRKFINITFKSLNIIIYKILRIDIANMLFKRNPNRWHSFWYLSRNYSIRLIHRSVTVKNSYHLSNFKLFLERVTNADEKPHMCRGRTNQCKKNYILLSRYINIISTCCKQNIN